jgi:hypothetical protein
MPSDVVTGKFGGPTVSQLITVLGGWCGNEADIAHRGRRLREARILPTGRRGGGRGSAEITSQHCVALLLGFMGTSNASRAVDVYRAVAALPYEKITMTDGNNEITMETAEDGGATDLSALAADLAKIVEIYRAGRRLSHRNLHLTGIHLTRDTANPAVRLELGSPEHEVEGREVIHYARPGHERGRTITSFWVDGRVVQLFADLLGPLGQAAP